MSKEIYKEYFNDWINAADEEEQIAVNKNYIWGGRTIADNNEMGSCDESCFFGLVTENLLQLKRKPKTQMINGHEVVAPKYGTPTEALEFVFVFDPANGCTKSYRSRIEWRTNFRFGYFENEKDAIAYANALRENKND